MEPKLIEELHSMQGKMLKSYETLNELNEVEIATTPKTAVYTEENDVIQI